MSIDIDEVFVMELEREIIDVGKDQISQLGRSIQTRNPPTNLRPILLLRSHHLDLEQH